MATKFITVSIEIMHDQNLNQSQKFILAEIEQLSQLDKGCIASNQHFSDLIGITKENVSRNINELQKKGYINIEIVNGTRNHTRIITLATLVRPPYQNSKTPLLKQQETKGIEQENKTINTKNVDYEYFMNAWNKFAEVKKKNRIIKLSDERKSKLRTRNQEVSNFGNLFINTLMKAGESEFLISASWFDFDWIVSNSNNYIKVLEGKYDDK